MLCISSSLQRHLDLAFKPYPITCQTIALYYVVREIQVEHCVRAHTQHSVLRILLLRMLLARTADTWIKKTSCVWKLWKLIPVVHILHTSQTSTDSWLSVKTSRQNEDDVNTGVWMTGKWQICAIKPKQFVKFCGFSFEGWIILFTGWNNELCPLFQIHF